MAGKQIIGVDIGGTSFRIGAVGGDGTVSGFRKVPVGQVLRSRDPLSDLAAYLEDYSRGMEPEAVSIGFPATLDRERQTVLQAPNVPLMENLPVAAVLRERMGVPVFLERDVTMALQYDMEKYRIPPRGLVIGIYYGTGVGNALCVNGEPLRGKHGTAGELGHIPVDGSDEKCGCGNVGCMENLAGGKYLVRLCREIYTDTAIGELFARHGSEPPLVQFVDRMAMAAATELNILDPDWLLIGGGVPQMRDFPRGLLLERIYAHARKPRPANDLPIVFTEDEEEKCVIGAARYARVQMKNKTGV